MVAIPDDHKRDERISLRATRRQVDAIDEAAALVQKTRTDFMLDAAYMEASRLLADRTVFVLHDQARDEFLAMLDRPPADNPALRALFQRETVLGRG